MIKVNDLYCSIQGEGKLAGTPMVVLRLQGCNVGCSWCDTKQTWNLNLAPEKTLDEALGENQRWHEAPESEVVSHVMKYAGPHVKWVMLTGGEPCEQPIGDLIKALQDNGFYVNLETSGTGNWDFLETARPDWICVSPKYQFVKPSKTALDAADEIKTVICTSNDLAGYLPDLCRLKEEGKLISLQPVGTSKSATAICINAALNYGFNLSIQIHKLINIA